MIDVVEKPEGLEEAIRAAKVAAGVDPDAVYAPEVWIEHLAQEFVSPFWHWQVDRVLLNKRGAGGMLLCPCGRPAHDHLHDADNPGRAS